MEKFTETIELNLPFQKNKFFTLLIAGVALYALGYGITLIPKIGFTGSIIIVICYFFPALASFDFFNNYQDEFKVEKLDHPKRHLITLLNVIFGWTFIGWIILLWWAYTPGRVTVEKVTYTE